ncbi:cobaltochelatase subunit CobN [Methanolobus sp. WCC1]|uniref:cobaltochelatase subunit CobN n=1 Tax=unclassified Methanolobus TaxID=2629569 RepID=UPI00325690F4
MQIKIKSILVLSILLMAALTSVAAAGEPKVKLTYIGYSESDAIKLASQTNDYNDLIEYTFIPYYDSGLSQELIDAAESGFLETQDVIFCQKFYSLVTNNDTVNASLKAAHDNGADIYSIDPMSSSYIPPSYFDYYSDGSTEDIVANYYSNMGTEGEGLENAENLLIYLTMHKDLAYIGYSESDAIKMASQTNDYSDLIEYTFIPYYDSDTKAITQELIDAAESGFLEKQDVIFCQKFYSKVTNNVTVNESLKAAHDLGTSLYSIDPMSSSYIPPSYFDYYSNGSTSDLLATYYSNMGTEGEGLENAENLLVHLTMNTKIAYIGYSESDAIKLASQTNDYSVLIEYTFIPYYDSDTKAITQELIDAAESGFLEKQDVIFCQKFYSKVTNNVTVNESLKAAHDLGASLYSIDPMSSSYIPPSYFDYYSNGSTSDLLATYYSNMGTEGEGLENAEELILHLAKYSPTQLKVAILGGSEVNFSELVFVLGTDFNEESLMNAATSTNISENLNITIFTPSVQVPEGFDFSNYGMIFIESQNESTVEDWTSSISSAKKGGSNIIGYNLSTNITLPNIDLYSDEYTDIERYWVQGNEENMKNMLTFMGQNFSGLLENESVSEPMILQEKVNVTFILNSNTRLNDLRTVVAEREIIAERFNVTLMDGEEATNVTDFSDQDVIILYMIGSEQIPLFKEALIEAQNSGTEIGTFGMDAYSEGIGTIDMDNHSMMQDYFDEGGTSNMESWIRYTGVNFEQIYIECNPVSEPDIPNTGIYHPDAFPTIFANCEEYIDWYSTRTDGGHIYDPDEPTIGIANHEINDNSLANTADDALIRYIESKGCNVIYSTEEAFLDDDEDGNKDADYYTLNGSVLVQSIIALKGFYINFDLEYGQEIFTEYNVPIIKGTYDQYQSTSEYVNSSHGLTPSSLYYQVAYPEIEGRIDYIWLAGLDTDEETGNDYYNPIDEQIEWICDRAIAWAELGEMDNSDKKVSIIYYNHEGGKNNIGASYLDIGPSFTLLLESMKEAGYDLGNNTIPNGSKFIDLFITSRNVGSWAPGELEKVIESGYVTMMPVDDYLQYYNELPESVREEVEETWGEAPGDIMTYENASGEYFVIPTIQLGNINFIPQPTRAGLSDESLIYHNESIPPTHQYLATYFWINNDYDADAMIHFGTHGTQEWLPGKEVGLWRYDYPSIMAAETPIIYPYIMDNVGEGTQAKRRGNAVIIDHLTPPIIEAGLYGELQTMHDKIHEYLEAVDDGDADMAALYRSTTIQLYDNLSMGEDLGVSTENLTAMSDAEFESFVDTTLHVYLHELQDELIPYGLHIFGVAPEDFKLVSMVKSMLGDDFTDHIYDVLSEGTQEEREEKANDDATLLLNATLINGVNVSDAQFAVLGQNYTSITEDLELALEYADNLEQTTREINQTLKALNAGYIEPAPGNDPIRNPSALPTGNNFYSFDQRLIPDQETQDQGSAVMKAWLESYYEENGEYPNKVAFVLWSVETMRHEGLMEAQIYELLGVKPVRNSGRLSGDFTVTSLEELGHPRIDVVIVPSGLYRDTFPFQLELLDNAVRTVADRSWEGEDNYVYTNSVAIEDAMLELGYNETIAHYISRSRIFSEAEGTYGTGVSSAAEASDTWENSTELADLFLSRMSNIYGAEVWGDNYEDVFKLNLADVDVAMHSDSSNLYGLIDNDDVYQYLGGLGLAIRSLGGDVSLFIADYTSVDNPEVITLEEAFSRELAARYLNPNWVNGMMEFDYAGARELMKTVEYMWGWEATTPDLVTDSDWDKIYETYIQDSQNIGVDDFLKENAYQYQSMTARMIENIRKGSWTPSDPDTLNNLVNEYVKSVVENGVTCCHHTCGNMKLADFTDGLMQDAGLTSEMQDAYRQLMYDATLRDEFKVQQQTDTSSLKTQDNSLNSVQRAMAAGSGSSNQTMMADSGGAGIDPDTPVQDSGKSTPDNYVEGYEMTQENVNSDNSVNSPTFSSSDILASVFTLGALGAIYLGFWKRRKF